MDLTHLRREYTHAGLAEGDLAADPIDQFRAWFAAWHDVAVGDANAMVVTTATPEGRPSVRTVLLRAIADGAFVFYTNHHSRKGREIAANRRVAILFPWHPLGRQVIVEGVAAPVDAATSDAYWATRPRGSQLAAIASPQSQPMPDRAALERRVEELDRRYEGEAVPRPEHWGGIRVVPDRFEFWQGRELRMHDRLVYRRDDTRPSGWCVERLAP
ncbi:MAG TPA: pyridoxamine 5'-phosphate oxidase [Acidimicrobiales bacterium]|nr:pyridoxamine 5'-phosphate oxidase [Acidimicrobiales bacterium]